MLHRRWLAWTGIAIGTLGSFGAISGCLQDGSSGDPGAGFRQPPGGSYVGATSSGTGGSAAGTGGNGGSTGAHDGGAGRTDAGAVSDGGASACVPGATATFSLAWTLEDAAGTATTCDAAGGKTVDLQVVDAASGATTSASFPCSALAATTCAMPGGRYSISMKLRDAQGAALSEVVAPILFLVDRQNTAVASLPFQVGADKTKSRGFALTWSIDKLATHASATCADARAATVRLTAGAAKFDMTCADGKGRTTALAPGSYAVTLDLLDAAGAVLSETQTMSVSAGAGQLVFLGDVPFDVN